jgi:hypothetical protein
VLRRPVEFTLATLIRVVYFRFAIAVYRVFQSIDTKTTIHTVRQPPAQHFSAKPVHDHREINKAVLHRQICDITRPNLVGLINAQVPQKIRLDPYVEGGAARSCDQGVWPECPSIASSALPAYDSPAVPDPLVHRRYGGNLETVAPYESGRSASSAPGHRLIPAWVGNSS